VSSSDHIGRRALLGIPLLTMPFAAAWAWAQGRGGRPGTTLPPPVPKSEAERRILDVIAAFDQSQRPGSMSVPFEDGRLLRILAESIGAQHVVEIGTSFGYSGLWLSLALAGTGGRLTTFEIDPARQARAKANFDQAGVLPRVTLVVGDAHVEVVKVKPPVDMVFSDADKDGYLDYFQKLSPVLRPGGLFVTHNIDLARPDYVRAISTNPGFDTTMVDVGAGEVALTLRKR
jgi:caffeoyl-CoA O-methyltransferase